MAGPLIGPEAAQIARDGARVPPDLRGIRDFLVRQGYNISDHGQHMGPMLRSALQDWHSGVGQRNPSAWNKAHNAVLRTDNKPGAVPSEGAKPINSNSPILSHQAHLENQGAAHAAAANKPHGVAGGPHPVPKGPLPHQGLGHGNRAGNNAGTGPPAPDFTSMLTGLLGGAGTSTSLPLSLADQIAAPDTAAANALQTQINELPSAKAKALKNIGDWYGQVQGAENTAGNRNQAAAKAGAASMADATKGIIAGLGGSAMGGSGEIGAMGANDANTLSAIGASDKQLANDLGPIFDALKAQASGQTQQQFQQGGQDLATQLGTAQGQGSADRANAVMQILQANNQGRQTNFQNAAGLLNTLASLQISGMNAQSQAQSRGIENAFKMSEIQKNLGKTQGGLGAMTPTEKADFVAKITAGLVDPNTKKLSVAWPQALRDARNSARTAGLNPMSQQVISQVIGPALANAGITGSGPNGWWPAIFQP